jgi:1-hydroxycarotenoid 3,4-desaturase
MAARSLPVVVIGAGMGGLVAAALLAARGLPVLVIERAATPGGKIREVMAGGVAVPAGPALLTLRPVFESIFLAAGDDLSARVTLRPKPSLGQHRWMDGARLDLPVEAGAAADAVGDFAGAAAVRGYLAFRERAKRIHDALEGPFLHAQRPGALALAAQAGLRGLLGASPFGTLWDALAEFFPDRRLRQVFSRVATYVGSSPLRAPATLMLVSHVEHQGLWAVEGGVSRLVEALAAVAARHGAAFRHGATVGEVMVRGGRAAGVRLGDGEAIEARAVVVNAEPASLAGIAGAVEALPAEKRSFSAVTWAMRADTAGIGAMQTVLHADDPTAEYADIGYRARLPAVPTVTLWSHERAGAAGLLAMVNAPARADVRPLPDDALARCEETVFARLRDAGLALPRDGAVVTTPTDFARLFPGSGGALYGPAVHGWQAAFSRPGARTRLPGLFVCGGGTHPGAGVAMAAISGRLAAARVIEDRA